MAVAVAVWGLAPAASAQVDDDGQPSGDVLDLMAQAEVDGLVHVLVEVADGTDPVQVASTALAGTEHDLGSAGTTTIGVEVDAGGLEQLAAATGVRSIQPDLVLHPATVGSGAVAHGGGHGGTGGDLLTAAARADDLHDRGIDGRGRRVAILDSGIDTSHPTFAGSSIIEECTVSTSLSPCPAPSGTGSAAPCDLAYLGCEHGTHVAGILAGHGSAGVPEGIAPGAEIIAIRVLSPFDVPADDPDVGAQVVALHSDVIAALDRVLALDAVAPIDAVNLSLGFGIALKDSCDSYDGGYMADKFAELRAAGIAPVVAAGNYGGAGGLGGVGLSFPACVTGAIPVTGVDLATGALWTGANRDTRALVAAPAANIPGAIPAGSLGNPVKSGTSLATPQVTGAIALMRQVEPAAPISDMTKRIGRTGSNVSGTATRRLDVTAAIGAYWSVTDGGSVHAAGLASPLPASSPTGSLAPGESYVAGTATPDGRGYWTVTNRGRVVAHGTAVHKGDRLGKPLNQPIVAMASTTSGRGYWLLAADGGIFTYGDASFYGSTGDMTLNAPVTDLAATPTGRGYWLTAKDGGVFSFGDASFYGSTGGMTLNQPVVSITAHPTRGYWLVALDGGVFCFGRASFHGSLPGAGVTTARGSRVRATVGGHGYYITTTDGGVHAFGNASPIKPRGLPAGATTVDIVLPPFN